MVLQAYEYEMNQPHIGGGGLNEFFTSTEGLLWWMSFPLFLGDIYLFNCQHL